METAGRHPSAVVIGAGISGLAAAHRLCELAAASGKPLEVTLLERTFRAGGPLCTIAREGFVVEAGADSFLVERPWALDLARRLGLEPELIPTDERFRKTYVVRRGRLIRVPEGFVLLAPARLWPVLRSTALSPRGRLRLALEPFIPTRPPNGDESLASFVRRRLGAEVLERLAQPLAAGIYGADPERLSLGATMPRFLEMERRHGSVIRGLRASGAGGAAPGDSSGARWALFLSLRGGIGTLVDALAARLGSRVRHGAEVRLLKAKRGAEGAPAGLGDDGRPGRWRVALAEGSELRADGVIVAAPAYDAAGMLAEESPALARLLGRIAYGSMATVNLAFREQDFPRPFDGFGFVVPAVERHAVVAASFSSLKFPGRAPHGAVLLRVFISGAPAGAITERGDEELVATARAELREICGVTAQPIFGQVARWPDSMPHYAVGHLKLLAEIEAEVARLPALELAGAAYRGVGIPDCVRSGETAAEALFATLVGANATREPTKAGQAGARSPV